MIHDRALAKLLTPLDRTVETVAPEGDLRKKLERGKPLRCLCRIILPNGASVDQQE